MAGRDILRRIALGIIVAGFVYGTATHALDFVRYGWMPYRFGPPILNAFWNMLVLLDAVAVVLLASGHRNPGLVLSIAVMTADVAANSYAWLALGFGAFKLAVPIQAAFLAIVLIATPFLWRCQAVALRIARR